MKPPWNTHVIAEAGSNANGEPALAMELVDCAGRSGADSVKFQIIYPDGLYRPGHYSFGPYDIRDVRAVRAKGVMSDDAWGSIAAHARAQGIRFSASVFDRRGLDLLCALTPPYIKIASCDLNNVRFVREVVGRGYPIVLSTGMATLAEVERTMNAINGEGVSVDMVTLLHCVSVYPATLRQMNLKFMGALRREFGTRVGLSDHTPDSRAACMAVAMGATWLEKHVTTDKTLPGFDHKYALEPGEFQAYVSDVRDAEDAMTPRSMKVSEAETHTAQRARRGVYAARDLVSGNVVQADDIAVLRPSSALGAECADALPGRVLRRDLAAGDEFTWEHFAADTK